MTNKLIVSNFNFRQNVHFTYFKDHARTYIDHVLVPKYFNENIIECTIQNDNFDCTSDHYPIKTVVRFMNDFAMNSETCTSVPSHPKPDWNNENFIETYISNITQLTSVVDAKFL